MMCEASENEVDINQLPHISMESDTDKIQSKIMLENDTSVNHQVNLNKCDDSALGADKAGQNFAEKNIGNNQSSVTKSSDRADGASEEEPTDLDAEPVIIESKEQCAPNINENQSAEPVDPPHSAGAVPEGSESAPQRIWNGHPNGTNEKTERQQREVMESQNGSGKCYAKYIPGYLPDKGCTMCIRPPNHKSTEFPSIHIINYFY